MTTDTTTLSLSDAYDLSISVMTHNGFAPDHARAIANSVCAAQRDDCQSHGLYRLIGCVHSIRSGVVRGNAVPEVIDLAAGTVRVDAKGGCSLLAFESGRDLLIRKARQSGLAALAINHCYISRPCGPRWKHWPRAVWWQLP